ncbi:MAG TPA: glycosyltransferase family 10 [Ilumatobacteraceae bacterium]|nr:glycosyltransferase family 10 [Ilumatobacteraceae bacterium]
MSHRPLLLLWADAWIDLDEARRLVGDRCTISDDRRDYDRAEAVIFATPAMHDSLPRQRAFPDQLWVQWSQESTVQYPMLLDEGFNAKFDLRMTYRLDSDVPIPYVTPDMFDALQPIVPLEQRNEVAVSAWVSGAWDRCGRDNYLLGLLDELPVHSYGTVGRNCHLIDDTGGATKMATIRHYRFTVAFENSMTHDYVTEKFFQALLAGSVPIYRGAPNVALFAPAPHSYIDATEFSGPAELAEFLAAMTDDLYADYHEWRAAGPKLEWRTRFASFATHAFVRLARAVDAIAIGRRAAATTDRDELPPPSVRGPGRPPSD